MTEASARPDADVPAQRKQGTADRMVAAFQACASGAEVMRTIDRARAGLDIMRQRFPDDFARVERARNAAFSRHCQPPEVAERPSGNRPTANEEP